MSITGTPARPQPAAKLTGRPQIAWPLQVTEEKVMAWVRRRLPGAREVSAQLYHHPMLGIAYRWRRPLAQPLLAHALVDLVGGRAYAADHWDNVAFQPIDDVEVSRSLTPPAPVVSEDEAEQTARRLVNSVLLRRRRLDFAGRLEEHDSLFFGKPNWWVQGVHHGRSLELVIDGLNGNHYVFRA